MTLVSFPWSLLDICRADSAEIFSQTLSSTYYITIILNATTGAILDQAHRGSISVSLAGCGLTLIFPSNPWQRELVKRFYEHQCGADREHQSVPVCSSFAVS